MAPLTRSAKRKTPPPDETKAGEADTIKRTRFFNAYDDHYTYQSLRSIAADSGTTVSSAHRWLQQRDALGSPAYRRTRKRSSYLGRRSRVSKEQCQMLVSPSRNSVRNQSYEAQIRYHKLGVKKRQLQRRLKACTNGAQMYKQAYIQKEISEKNLKERIKYGQENEDKSVEDHWQFIFFTDEAHIDPSSLRVGTILRERGHRYDPENIQERPEKTGVRLHVAGWVNWHCKALKLEFYNDENDYVQKPKRPPKPRKSKYESEEEYNKRILEWEASIGHEQEVKPKGNAMTQKYYTKRLLPVYINAIHNARLRDPQS